MQELVIRENMNAILTNHMIRHFIVDLSTGERYLTIIQNQIIPTISEVT